MSLLRLFAGPIAVVKLLAVLLLLGTGRTPAPGYAGTDFTITRSDNPAPDGCAPTDCSLREAVIAANALAGADTIILPPDIYTLKIAGADEDRALTGDLDIADDLVIKGAGRATTTIDGGAFDRVFQISGPSAGISGVTIRNGRLSASHSGIKSLREFTLTDVTVTDNGSPEPFGCGGGISSVGTMTTINGTISNNLGAFAGGISTGGTATITNTVVHNNRGTGLEPPRRLEPSIAGGILVSDATTVSITDSTISGNSASRGGGGIQNEPDGDVSVKNTIIANNTGSGDCFGPITSDGHNLARDDTCGLTSPGDLPNTNPRLGPLGFSGGPTRTHAPFAGSPAIDADTNVGCLDTDQRGARRS